MSTLLLLLILHGLFLALLLGLFGRRHDRANAILALLIFTASLLLLEMYVQISGLATRWPHLRGVFRPLWFLIGPLAYLYILRFLGREVRQRYLLAALPALLVVVWQAPFYARGAEAKLSGPLYPGGLAGAIALYFAFSLLTAVCALRSRAALVASRAAGTPFEQPWRYAWLQWLMGALAGYAVLDFVGTTVMMGRGHYPAWAAATSVVLLAALIYGAGLLVALPEGLLARAPWPGKKYERSEIAPDAAERQLQRLETLMSTEKPWLDDTLKLDDLAQQIGVSRHHLSQLMNQHLETTFHDFVNARRVEEAKRLLIEVGSRRSILDVGFDAGFGSSATFYRAFKKHVGVTPKDFLASVAGSDVERFRRHEGS